MTILIVVLTSVVNTTLLCRAENAGNETGEDSSEVVLSTPKERWVYKKVNGRQYKRLADATNGIWLTDWILCDNQIGDINKDSFVNAKDALLILRHAAGMVKLSASEQESADVNNDGVINARDAMNVLRMAVS